MIELIDTTLRGGARVKTLRVYPNNYGHSPNIGAVGTVMPANTTRDGFAVVKFDEYFDGHDVNRMFWDKYGTGYYWSYKVSDLEVIG